MKRFWKILFLILFLGFIGVQFFPVEKNSGELFSETDLIQATTIPPDLGEKIMTSCYDCHSNSTKYPWYGYVAPVSWMIYDHVTMGKEKVNFSIWGSYTKSGQVSLLFDMCKEIAEETMPLPGYQKLHPESVFNNDEMFNICVWTEEETIRLMGN